MTIPRMTDPNDDHITPEYRDRIAPAPTNNAMWGVLAAVVVAVGVCTYMYSNYSYTPRLASETALPAIGNSPAPVTPDAPSPPVRKVY